MANTQSTGTTRKEETFGQQAAGMAQHAADKGKDLLDKGKEMAKEGYEKGKEWAREGYEKGKDMVKDAAGTVGTKAEDYTASAGSGLRSAAGAIRENAPHSGMLGSAASGVASGLESAGRYLEENKLSGIANDLTDMIRRNPVPALLVGIGVGFLLARATSSRS